MTNTLILVIAAGSVTALTILRILYSRRKDHLYKLFREAMQCESKGDEEGAMQLYIALMEKAATLSLKDSDIVEEARKRLKTLQIKISERNYYARFKGGASSGRFLRFPDLHRF